MSAIERVRVGDVLRLRREEVSIEPGQEYTLIGIYSFGKGIFHRDAKPGAELGNYRFFRIRRGDLVLSNIQAWEGAIGLASACDEGTIGTHRFLSYTPVDDRIDPNWARWFFLSEPGMELIRQAAPGTAVRNRTLAVQRFENLVIPLPPIEEQLRVALQLTTASRKFGDRLKRADQLSEAIVPALLNRAFEGLASTSPTAKKVRVGDVLRLRRSEVQIEPDQLYRLVGIYSFGKGIFHRDPKPGAELGDYRFFRIEPGDLVLSNIQAWEGAIALAGQRDAGTIGTHRFLSYEAVDGQIDTDWARWFFLSEPGMERIRRAAPGTAVRNRTLALKRFEDLVIPLPPIEQQRRVAAVITAANKKFGHRRERVHQLADAIVPALLNREFGSAVKSAMPASTTT